MKLFLWLLSLQVVVGLAAAGANQTFSGPIVPANPEAAGKELVAKLLSLRPTESMTNRATLTTYSNRTELGSIPLIIEVTAGETGWTTTYVEPGQGSAAERLTVAKANDGSTTYHAKRHDEPQKTLSGGEAFTPIAGSDFTLADVGMEFLHWPTQRLLKKEVRRTQSCDKLESIAPHGWPGDYVRVLSWFDVDTGGPVVVEAYNGKGKLVKEFRPTKFEKVDGQYRVEEIEMNTFPAKTRSIIRFDVKASAR
jgi:hypothetical protein